MRLSEAADGGADRGRDPGGVEAVLSAIAGDGEDLGADVVVGAVDGSEECQRQAGVHPDDIADRCDGWLARLDWPSKDSTTWSPAATPRDAGSGGLDDPGAFVAE